STRPLLCAPPLVACYSGSALLDRFGMPRCSWWPAWPSASSLRRSIAVATSQKSPARYLPARRRCQPACGCTVRPRVANLYPRPPVRSARPRYPLAAAVCRRPLTREELITQAFSRFGLKERAVDKQADDLHSTCLLESRDGHKRVWTLDRKAVPDADSPTGTPSGEMQPCISTLSTPPGLAESAQEVVQIGQAVPGKLKCLGET